MGFFFPLHYLMHGGTVVFSSPSFDAKTMIKALEEENVTHTAIVPTILHALIDTIETRNTGLDSSLLDVCLSGGSVTPENVRRAFTVLKSKGVSTGFGMTEGSPVWTGPRQDPADLLIKDPVIAGKALPRGQVGEIHQTGQCTIEAYLGGARGAEQFYQDEQGQTWFITGDQAIMHPDGRLTITGRYKDMIIRGGENIASAAIEAVIGPYCHGQKKGFVVGAPDTIAGEIPVMVLPEAHLSAAEEMRKAVLQRLGAACVPERTFTLRQLGLDDFPKTSSGKVQKSLLASRVRAAFDAETATNGDELNGNVATENPLLVAYHKSTGIPVGNLDVDMPVRQFADSIAFMRVREYLRKAIGRTISMQDMIDYPTISAQMKLLQRQAPVVAGRKQVHLPVSHQPDMQELEILLIGQQGAAELVRSISQVLEAKGLNWSQVSSVIPVHDYMHVLLDSKMIDTWNFTIAVSTKEPDAEKLRAALRKALANNPILTSFVARDPQDNAHYITVNSNDALWNLGILDRGIVETAADMEQMAVEFAAPDMSKVPGSRASDMLSARTCQGNQFVHDPLPQLFLEDLEEALTYPNRNLAQHASFKAWSDSYFYLRHSPAATNSVRFHAGCLSDLHTHQAGFYPPERLPRRANTSNPDGYDYAFDAADLTLLREEYPDVSAAMVLRAAQAIVNVHRTRHSHAAFFNFEAGRRQFPFVPSALQRSSPETFEVSDINGPVMQGACNLIEVRRGESAVDMPRRMRREQGGLTKHTHALLRRVIEELNEHGNGAGDAMVDVHRAQFTTWVPGLLGDCEKLQVSRVAIRCAAGLVVVAGMGGDNATTYLVSMRWDEANYPREETVKFLNDLELVVRRIIAPENREREIGECLDFLDKAQEL
ncbi:putative secondary metabolism biosynthetic enzyme [Pestalotiopsis sp. IQ-011]